MTNEIIWIIDKIVSFGLPGIASVLFYGGLVGLAIYVIRELEWREIPKEKNRLQWPIEWPAEFQEMVMTKRSN
jgi:hypothetical protein